MQRAIREHAIKLSQDRQLSDRRERYKEAQFKKLLPVTQKAVRDKVIVERKTVQNDLGVSHSTQAQTRLESVKEETLALAKSPFSRARSHSFSESVDNMSAKPIVRERSNSYSSSNKPMSEVEFQSRLLSRINPKAKSTEHATVVFKEDDGASNSLYSEQDRKQVLAVTKRVFDDIPKTYLSNSKVSIEFHHRHGIKLSDTTAFFDRLTQIALNKNKTIDENLTIADIVRETPFRNVAETFSQETARRLLTDLYHKPGVLNDYNELMVRRGNWYSKRVFVNRKLMDHRIDCQRRILAAEQLCLTPDDYRIMSAPSVLLPLLSVIENAQICAQIVQDSCVANCFEYGLVTLDRLDKAFTKNRMQGIVRLVSIGNAELPTAEHFTVMLVTYRGGTGVLIDPIFNRYQEEFFLTPETAAVDLQVIPEFRENGYNRIFAFKDVDIGAAM